MFTEFNERPAENERTSIRREVLFYRYAVFGILTASLHAES